MKKRFLAGIMALCLIGGTNVPEIFSSIKASAEESTADTTEVEVLKSGKWGKSGTWTLDADGVLTISGEGTFPGLKDKLTSDEIKTVIGLKVGDGINNIGTEAFYNYINLEYIEFPETVTTIGESAFNNCTSLYDVQLPESLQVISVEAFYNCKSLTSIVIPDNVVTIDEHAFESSGLTEVTLGKGIKKIAYGAFYHSNVGTVIYRGNKKAWNNISISSDNYVLTDNPDNIIYLVNSGDSNVDGDTTIADAVLIMQVLSNPDEYSLSDTGMLNADVLDSDGVSTADALVIQMVVANTVSTDVLPLTSDELAKVGTPE